MKTNFTNSEIGYIASAFAPEMNVRINKAGNIILRHIDSSLVQFTIRRHDNGIKIRREVKPSWFVTSKSIGHYMNNNKPLLSVAEVVDYFKSYVEKYPENIKTARY